MIDFPTCPICQISNWEIVYEGDIRNGHVDNPNIRGVIKRCLTCGIERLNESSVIQQENYTCDKYREILRQDFNLARHRNDFSSNILNLLEFQVSFEGKVVADIGCSAGVALDSIQPNAKKTIAIEPSKSFSQSLIERNHEWFPTSSEALIKYRHSVDVVMSNLVIEHVEDPVVFLQDAVSLLNKDGLLILSTPNRDDVLTKMLPENFKKFNYRSQHRWYFDESSLIACFKCIGLNVIDFDFMHTLGMSNMLNWLENKKPTKNKEFPIINDEINIAWVNWVKKMKLSDKIVVVANSNDGPI